MRVKRVENRGWIRLYLPTIFAGMWVTLKHLFRRKDTLQYPEQRPFLGPRYRGVPVLVKDETGREKCVACYMCQWVCPPLAISIEAAEYPPDHPLHQIEKYPARFEINMLRCIYCGLCEEACPEEAIFMSRTYAVVGTSRETMIFDKQTLYEIGGVRPDEIRKWSPERKGPPARSHVPPQALVEPPSLHYPADPAGGCGRGGVGSSSMGLPRHLGAAALAAAWAFGPAAAAITGQVVDERGRPLEGAKACLLVAEVEGLCAQTDEAGAFVLPESRVPKMRIRMDGYVPVTLPAVTQTRAIVLERAAVLRVVLREKGSGRALAGGQVYVSYTTGRQLGPFPANENGVRVRSLPRGEAVVRAEAAGYAPATCVLKLVAGEEGVCTVHLERHAGDPRD